MKRLEWTEERVQFLKDKYNKLQAKDIAQQLGCSVSAVTNKVKKLGLNKDRKCYGEKEIDYVREHHKLPNQTLAEQLKVSVKTIQRIRKENDIPLASKRIKYTLPHKRKWNEETVKYIMENKEQSNEFFAKELGLDQATIRRIRKLFNIDNPNTDKPFRVYASTAEQDVKCMLDLLGIKYEPQFPVGHYYVDFMIGNKVIEVQGNYWHNNPEWSKHTKTPNERQQRAMETDREKKQLLETMGYDVLYIWETEIEDGRAIQKLRTFLQNVLCHLT